MAEENTATADDVAPTVPFALYDSEQYDAELARYSSDELGRTVDPTTGFAKSISNRLSQDYPDDPNFVGFEALTDGTAGFFEMKKADGGFLFPQLASQTPAQRAMTSSSIITTFVRDMQGKRIKSGTRMEGFKRKVAGGVAALPAGYYAASATNALLQANPATAVPVTPIQWAVRVLGPLSTGAVAAYGAMEAGNYLTDEAIGPERLYTPESRGKVTFGEVVGENIGLAALPFALTRTANLGALNLAKQFEAVTGIGKSGMVPISRKGQIEYMPFDKVEKLLGFRMTRGTENLINRLAQEAKDRPFPVAAAESMALLGGAQLAQASEEQFPGQVLPRMVGEVAGGITGGIIGDFLAKRLVTSVKLGITGYKKLREEGVSGAFESYQLSKKEGNNAEIANFMIDFIERYGEDVDTVIANLNDTRMTQILADYEAANGVKVDLTSGVRSRSPVILALEKALETTTTGIGKQRGNANREAVEAMRTGILAMYGTGDPEMVKAAATQMREVFEGDLQVTLDKKLAIVRDSFEKLRGGSADDSSELAMSQLGLKYKELVETSARQDRALQRRLWLQVPEDLMLPTTFTNPQGVETNVPNFISFWESMKNTDAPEADADEMKFLSSLVDYTNRKKQELGLDGTVVGPETASAVPQVQRTLSEANDALIGRKYNAQDVTFDTGFPTTNLVQKMRSEGASQVEIISALRQEASRQKGLKGDTHTALRKAFTAQADYLVAQGRKVDPKSVAVDAQRTADSVAPSTPEVEGVTIKGLAQMRSKALALARQADGPGGLGNRAYGLAMAFVSAVERDMASLPEGANLEFDLARSFSRAFNDVYTRGFAGDIVQSSKKGGDQLVPEQIGRKLFSQNMGTVRVAEVDLIGQSQLNASLGQFFAGHGPRGKQLADEARDAALNADTKIMDFNKLRSWLTANKAELESLPGIQYTETGPEGARKLVATEGGTLYGNINDTITRSVSLQGTSENILRQIRTETTDPNFPEKINASALRKWMGRSENKQILTAFPDLKADLDAFIGGNDNVMTAFNRAFIDQGEKIREQKAVFSFYSLISDKTENPATVIMNAANSPYPSKALENLWRPIKEADATWTSRLTNQTFTKAEAKAGFRSSLLDSIMLAAGSDKGGLNASTAYRQLFAPMEKSKNKIRMSEWLVQNDVFSETEMGDIEDLFGKMVEFEGTLFSGSGGDINALMSKLGPSADLILSVLGSAAGTRLQNLIPGDSSSGSLIAAGRGASAFRDAYKEVFKSIPNMLKTDMLKEIIKDPEALSLLLQKGKTDREESRIGGRLAEWLVDNLFAAPIRRAVPGLITPEDESQAIPYELVPSPPAKTPVPEKKASYTPPPRIQQQPPEMDLPPLRQRQAVPSGVQTASVDPARTTGGIASLASGPVDRAKAQQLFPNDITFAARGGAINSGIGVFR
jgi:hypothetical protein|tara:strand:+ start:1882 stop:6165 length:4284 start_codon:yes stop_codon:yes gene_type:complete